MSDNQPVQPETRSARSGDVSIAYQVVGDGPFDVVHVPGFVSHVELSGQVSGMAHFSRRLGSFSRLIRFDKRGTGMSDRVAGAPTLETRMDDARMNMEIDVRSVLPAIRVPTLILNRTEDNPDIVGGSRYLAEHIARARHIDLPGADHALCGRCRFLPRRDRALPGGGLGGAGLGGVRA